MAENPKVFCSHNSVDKLRVKEVAAKLRAEGIDAWVDQWEIRPGDNSVARINEGLASYNVGLLFLSKTSLESVWVTAEVSSLIHQMIQGGKPVIPVMIDADAPVPPLLDSQNRLDIDQVDELIAAIYGGTDKPPVAPQRPGVSDTPLSQSLNKTQTNQEGPVLTIELYFSQRDVEFDRQSYLDKLREIDPSLEALNLISLKHKTDTSRRG